MIGNIQCWAGSFGRRKSCVAVLMAGGNVPAPSVRMRSGANKGSLFSIFLKNRLAAGKSRLAVSEKSTGLPCYQ